MNAVEKLKVGLTDQKLDLLTIGANVDFLAANPSGDLQDIEGFDSHLAKSPETVFRAIYTAADEQEAEFLHKMVMTCLQKMKTTMRLMIAQDRLQWRSEGFVADMIAGCNRDDTAYFHTLALNYTDWRNAQGHRESRQHAKPSTDILKGYSDLHNRIFSDYQAYHLQPEKQRMHMAKRYERDRGHAKMVATIWDLRTEYANACTHENAITINAMQEKLVQIAVVQSAIRDEIIAGNPFTDEVIASNLQFCRDKFYKASALQEGASRMVSQMMDAYLANPYRKQETPEGYSAIKLSTIPSITP